MRRLNRRTPCVQLCLDLTELRLGHHVVVAHERHPRRRQVAVQYAVDKYGINLETFGFCSLVGILNFIVDKTDNVRLKIAAIVERFHRQVMAGEEIVERFPQRDIDFHAPW